MAGVSSGGDATGINASQLSINGSRTLNSEFTVDPRTGRGVFNSPDFGLITSARAARFLQLVARIEF